MTLPVEAGADSAGNHEEWEAPPRLKHLDDCTFRDATPHSFTTNSRPAASIRALASPDLQPQKPRLPAPSRRSQRRAAAVGASPVGCSSERDDAGREAPAAAGDIQAAWVMQESQAEQGIQHMFLQVEVRGTRPWEWTCC